MENKQAATPLNQLLRRIPRDAQAEITLKSGWSYHTNIGELVNRAAEHIEQSAQQSVHLTALRRGLAVSILLNVILLAVVLAAIGGR